MSPADWRTSHIRSQVGQIAIFGTLCGRKTTYIAALSSAMRVGGRRMEGERGRILFGRRTRDRKSVV